jgi:glycolate oxidase iron-sulfur subunit
MTDRFADVREDLLRCIKCGTCASVCPTYNALHRETTSARGRVSLIDAMLAGELEPTPEMEELLYLCLSCHSCVPACPNGVRVDKLVLAARASFADRNGGSIFKRAIFEGLLPHPERLDAAVWPVRLYQALGLKALAERLGIVERLPGRLGIYGQMVPRMPLRSALSKLAGTTPAKGERKGKVGYFLGCAQNLGFPETAAATVGLLSLAGYDVVVSREIVCCGMPSLAYGAIDATKDLAKRNLEAFAGQEIEALVTDCASCGSFLKEYGELLADEPEWAAKAAAMAQITVDVSEFLSAHPPQGERRSLGPLRITYHDPCHLGHAQGVKQQPRDLLRQVPDLELVEMRTQGACCGSAGSYALTHPEVSVEILDSRVEQIAETQATVVATGCPACQIQLGFGVRRGKVAVQLRHPVEILAAAYGLPSFLDNSARSEPSPSASPS